MKIGKGIHGLIEHNITGNINTPFRNIKAFETLVFVAIAKKNALLRPKLQFLGIIRTQVWLAGAAKGTKGVIIGCLLEQTMKRCLSMYNLARKPVDQISSSDKGLVPKFQGHRGVSKQG